MPVDYSLNKQVAVGLQNRNLKGANEMYDSAIYHEFLDNKEYGNAADYLSQYTFTDPSKREQRKQMISDLRHRQAVRDYYRNNITDGSKREKYLSAADLTMDIASNYKVQGNGYYQTRFNSILEGMGGTVKINGQDVNCDTFRFYLDESLTGDGWNEFKSRFYDFFTPASYSNTSTKDMFNAIFGSIDNNVLRSTYGISIDKDSDGEYVDVAKDNPKLMEIIDKFSMLTYRNHINGKDKINDRGNHPVVDDHGNETPDRWAMPRFKVYAINKLDPSIRKVATAKLEDSSEYDNISSGIGASGISRNVFYPLITLVNEAKSITKNLDSYNNLVDEYYGVEKSVDASTIYDANYLHPAEVILDQLRESQAIDGPEYKRYRDQYDADIYDKLFTTFANAAQYPIYSNYTGKSGNDELSSIMSLVSNAKRQNLGDIVLKALNDKRGVEVRAGYTSGMYGAYIMIGPEANTGEARKKDEFYRRSIKVFIPNFTGLEEQMFGDNVDAQLNKEKWDLDRWHKDYTTLSGGYIENKRGDYTYYLNNKAYNKLDAKSVENIIREDLNLRTAQNVLLNHISESKNLNKDSYKAILDVAGKMVGDMITEKYGIENPYEAFHDEKFRNENQNAFKDYKRYFNILVGSVANAHENKSDGLMWYNYGLEENYMTDHINKIYR